MVVVLAWIQPLWEQLFGEGEGNLQRLATHAGEGDLTVGGGDGGQDRRRGRRRCRRGGRAVGFEDTVRIDAA